MSIQLWVEERENYLENYIFGIFPYFTKFTVCQYSFGVEERENYLENYIFGFSYFKLNTHKCASEEE